MSWFRAAILALILPNPAGAGVAKHPLPPPPSVHHELLPERVPQPPECAKTQAGRVRALVVGIDHYPRISDVKGAINDAKLLATALRQHGAEVFEAEDLDRIGYIMQLMNLAIIRIQKCLLDSFSTK